ncbi:MAG: hypothetical protein ACU0E9_07705 [Limimaricola soesokkakensis]|uniref:hypothetical protein n=1 Tax=Limimaricola soesokkakensis TaxID=1343159 RepID=UPI0040596CFB
MIGRAFPWIAGALLLAGAALAIERAGYHRGTAEIEAAVAQARADLTDKLHARDAALRDALAEAQALRAERAGLIERIENDARSAPGADRLALPADSLHRLRARWGDLDPGSAAGGDAALRPPWRFPGAGAADPGPDRNPGRPDR